MCPNQYECYNGFRPRPHCPEESQHVTNDSLQGQSQHLIIRRSHNINIAQGQAQALVDLEISLQAAIEALLVLIDAEEEVDDTNLQELLQQLKVIQTQKEIIAIECSDDINIIQAQVQIEIVVQAVIQLLAKITAKLVEA